MNEYGTNKKYRQGVFGMDCDEHLHREPCHRPTHLQGEEQRDGPLCIITNQLSHWNLRIRSRQAATP